MHFLPTNLHFLVVLFLFFSLFKAQDVMNDKAQHGVIANTIIVDKNGEGNFTSVQKAIDFIPSNNRLWTLIRVKAGIYNEKVKVPRDKPFVFLKGEGGRSTVIQWSEAGSSTMSATLFVDADNFMAANISFKNTYNLVIPVDNNGHRILWAPAATIYGDKASFYHCGFSSVQDTLTDANGHHYFHSCYIQGTIDFIWGDGQSIYQRCILNATAINGTAGHITAQARNSPKDSSGFVFNECLIAGDGPVYLGRAYKQYSRVVFKNTYMSDIVRPVGWEIWDQKGKEDSITFTEVGCKGPGADKSRRVPWEKKLSARDLKALIDVNIFINQDGWLEKQPKLHA